MAVDGVHFVGSVNLPDAQTSFRSLAVAAGPHAARVPDGETGARATWIGWLIERLRRSPVLEEKATAVVAGRERPCFGLADGASPAGSLRVDLGYADAALQSYQLFADLREQGVIRPGTRFQVTFATPGVLSMVFIKADEQLRLENAVRATLAEQIDAIAAKVPHEDLAIQWDAPAEVGMMERMFPSWYPTTDTTREVTERLAGLAALVPADVELGFHLCYGDSGDVDDPEGSHWKNPDNLGVVTSMMNELTAATPRPIGYFHVPVPIRRDDVAYFAPLEALRIPDTCTLYLGLLHREDGLEGARRRITAARSVRSAFGLATECGMGRERRESINGLLALHGAAPEL
jgi:hypothetical protein